MAAWVKGGATDADTAIGAAVSLLAKARAPVIAGLSADVAAIRAAYDLAGRIGASIDTAGAVGTYAELGALSRVGAMTSTPAEAVGRPMPSWSSARALAYAAPEAPDGGKPTRGRAAGADRTLLALGAGSEGSKAALSCPSAGGLAEAVAELRAYAKGISRVTRRRPSSSRGSPPHNTASFCTIPPNSVSSAWRCFRASPWS